jgi:hypothetical protein
MGTRNEVTRVRTVGDGLVVGVLARVEDEKDEIVDRWIEAAEAKWNVVSGETFESCVVPSTVEYENVPFDRSPGQEQEAGGEEPIVDEIVEDTVAGAGRPNDALVVVRQLNWNVDECLESVGDEEKNDGVIVKSCVQRSCR